MRSKHAPKINVKGGLNTAIRLFEPDCIHLNIVLKHLQDSHELMGRNSVSSAIRWALWRAAENIKLHWRSVYEQKQRDIIANITAQHAGDAAGNATGATDGHGANSAGQ